MTLTSEIVEQFETEAWDAISQLADWYNDRHN